MKPVKIFVALLLMIFATSSVDAQTVPNDRRRIKQGVRSGELTRSETRRVVHQQRAIRQDVRQAKSDGVVTPAEKREIKQEKRKADRTIYRKKHNRRDRI